MGGNYIVVLPKNRRLIAFLPPPSPSTPPSRHQIGV